MMVGVLVIGTFAMETMIAVTSRMKAGVMKDLVALRTVSGVEMEIASSSRTFVMEKSTAAIAPMKLTVSRLLPGRSSRRLPQHSQLSRVRKVLCSILLHHFNWHINFS